ncbi:MAG: histidinol-phosphate transaminase, partial [Planctomycetota bacterium]|nr:histidinol-phosphate transaminase [Planctomycetota bacterium]
VAPDNILATAGADEAIDRLCRALLNPGDTLLTHTPSFEMIPRYAALAGAETRALPWPSGPFPTAAFINELTPDTPLAAIVTPNNPTGATVPLADLLSTADRAAENNTLLLVDLAYVEFADAPDPTRALLSRPNVAITRTLSKCFGLAGARVGFLIASPDLIELARAAAGPFSVAAPSIAVATAALRADPSASREYIKRIRFERERLTSLLNRLGAEALPSQANFVFARTPRAQAIRNLLLSRGISIRAFPSILSLSDALRITCPGNDPDFTRLTEALRFAGAAASENPAP